jgi:hypothetical protein
VHGAISVRSRGFAIADVHVAGTEWPDLSEEKTNKSTNRAGKNL